MSFTKEKKSGGFGLLDMMGSLGQFEEYGKALVEFQKQVLASLSRIEADQAKAAEERAAIMAKLDLMKTED